MSQSTAVRAARPSALPAARTAVRTSPRPAARPGTRPVTPRLRVVAPPPQTRSRAPMVVGCLLALAGGLVGLLLLNVNLEKGAFVSATQRRQIERLQEQRQSLAEDIARREAPQALAARALELGMVQNPGLAFVRTSDRRVLGKPSPGVASAPRTVATSASSAPGGGSATATPSGGAAQTSAKVTASAAATTTATSPTTGAGTHPRSSAPTAKQVTAATPTSSPSRRAPAARTTVKAGTTAGDATTAGSATRRSTSATTTP